MCRFHGRWQCKLCFWVFMRVVNCSNLVMDPSNRALSACLSVSFFRWKRQIFLSPNRRYAARLFLNIAHSKKFARVDGSRGTFFLSLFLPLPSTSFFNLNPGLRATFSIARTWREITLGIMRSAIFPRIHQRWKSSRNKDGARSRMAIAHNAPT